MQISRIKPATIELKTKLASVVINDHIQIGEVIIDGPGEYDAAEVATVGIPHEDKTIYCLSAEDMRLCSLPEGVTNLPQSVTEQIGSVDILLVPITETVTVNDVLGVVNQLEPTMIIPLGEGALIRFQKQGGDRGDLGLMAK